MSDFFIGQLLVFASLLPVLIRPFFKGLRALTGIPLLALLGLAICIGLAASGARLLFLPLFVLALITLFSQAPAFLSMARGLPYDWFGVGIKIFNAILLALFAALVALSAYFMPEPSYIPQKEVSVKAEKASLSAGFRYNFQIFAAEEDDADSGALTVLLYFPSFPAGRTGRDTFLAMAAERGLKAYCAQWSGKSLYSNILMNPKALRDFSEILLAAAQGLSGGEESEAASRFAQAQEGVMQTVILDAARFAASRLARERPGRGVRLFAVAEGYACAPLAAIASANPNLFAGAAYLLPEKDAMSLNVGGAESLRVRGLNSPLPRGASDFSQIVITDSEGALGFGEMTAEDPALAALLGFERDEGRQTARLAAERVLAWIEARK